MGKHGECCELLPHMQIERNMRPLPCFGNSLFSNSPPTTGSEDEMGYGYDMACSKCGRHHAVTLGCGFSLPTVYSELVSDIETGAFGKEWQELAAQTECFAIDVETHLFRCETCGFWECAPSLSIYTPKDVEKTLETQYGEKTVREWGRVPHERCDPQPQRGIPFPDQLCDNKRNPEQKGDAHETGMLQITMPNRTQAADHLRHRRDGRHRRARCPAAGR